MSEELLGCDGVGRGSRAEQGSSVAGLVRTQIAAAEAADAAFQNRELSTAA